MGRTPHGQTRRRVHDFVRRRLLDGNPPTVREVQQAFGFRAVETARGHLEALVAAGAFEKTAGRSRGLRGSGRSRRISTCSPICAMSDSTTPMAAPTIIIVGPSAPRAPV